MGEGTNGTTTTTDCDRCVTLRAENLLLRTALEAIRAAVDTSLDRPPVQVPHRN